MIFRFGRHRLDTDRLELRRGDETVAVEPQVFDLLRLLIENRDRMVSRDEIIEAVWNGRIVSESTLSSRINAARRAVGDDGKRQDVIRTLPRRGFRFVAPVSVDGEQTRLADDGDRAAATPPPLPARPSVVVLPFENMSADPDQEYFSDGITEDLITELSRISGLFVIARHSAFTYKGRSVSLKQVGRDLGVRYVIEGSVRKAGNRLRIAAQLMNAATDRPVWAERYDRDLGDVFAIQDEITRSIVDALKVTLNLDERARIGSPDTANIEAYDFALRGRELLYRGTRGDYAAAAGLFEDAIALDPRFVMPYWGLAIALFVAHLNGWEDASANALERGRQLALTAIEMDPTDSQGYSTLARANLWSRDLEGAIVAADKAVAFGPNNAEAFEIRGHILSFAGRPEEAIESLERGIRLDPRPQSVWLYFLAHAYFVAERFETAASLLSRRIRLNPETDISRVLLASCYGHLGRKGEARAEWARAREINPDYSIDQKSRVLPYENPADWERFVVGLRKAGLPG